VDVNSRTADQVIAALARRTHGVVTRQELLGAGISTDEIQGRLDRGSLIAVYDGVYRVGHAAPSVEASFIAAVKACGEGSLLRKRAAAYLWRLIQRPPKEPEVLTTTERKVKGIKTQRARAGIHKRDRAKYRGIPVTSVARTIVDLAADAREAQLARIFHEAVVKHGTKPEHVEEVLKRRPSAKGAKKLRAAMYGDQALTLSNLEDAFNELLRAADLPLPKTNKRKGSHLIDCRWLEPPVTVELDSYTYHSTRHAWEQDRRRDREAHDRGDRVRRFTRREVLEEPDYVVDAVGLLLGRLS
jgi:very-short-patch-repair endonuclease